MKSRIISLAVLALTVGLAVAVTAPRLRQWWMAPPHGYCPICRRHEHGDSVVKLQAKGEGVIEVCCLSCAFSYGRQTSKPVTILSVTNHETGKPLTPDAATFVVGSDVSPCAHNAQPLRIEGEAVPVHWDRCLPSILAFPSAEAAETFRAQHGGRVHSFMELVEKAASSNKPLE
jgi:hypothetical protein